MNNAPHRWSHWTQWNFHVYLHGMSIRCFVAATGYSFGAILTLNGSHDVISQPLVLFGGHINIDLY